MKKLRLQVDALRVEAFEVAPREVAAKGTVHGQAAVTNLLCQPSAGGSCDTGIPVCNYCRL